jgi:flagellar biosynthesis protein FlhB
VVLVPRRSSLFEIRGNIARRRQAAGVSVSCAEYVVLLDLDFVIAEQLYRAFHRFIIHKNNPKRNVCVTQIDSLFFKHMHTLVPFLFAIYLLPVRSQIRPAGWPIYTVRIKFYLILPIHYCEHK